MRNKIVAGNWKMNTTISEGKKLVIDILSAIEDMNLQDKKVVFASPFISLSSIAKLVNYVENVYVGSQNISSHESGAYTGEISANMLAAAGVKFAIVGHSERREYFSETNQVLAEKVSQSIDHRLIPIYCCGEVLEERKNGNFKSVIKSQIEEGLFHLTPTDFSRVVIAYEPVWAIGTGETASPDQAQEVHAFIRQLISEKYGEAIAELTSILYGGSMKPDNAKRLMTMPDIDGGLVGGASLNASDFVKIIKSM